MRIKNKDYTILQIPYAGINYIMKYLYDMKANIDGKTRIKKYKKKTIKHNGPIKVGFLVQFPEVWDKEKPIYDAMKKSYDFEPLLITIPDKDISNNTFAKVDKNGYFLTNYPDAIVGYQNNEWISLESLHLDYLFYQRCYENYLPSEYCTEAVIKYTMTCYIPYCYHVSIEHEKYYKTSFFYNLGFFFCCSNDQFERVPGDKFRRKLYFGYPALEKQNKSRYRNSKINVLWTPRWTDDPDCGGTTFFDYKDKIIELKNNRINILLRPHPLTFREAIRSKKMSAKEISEYREWIYKNGGTFDNNTSIEDTFQMTDVLITDFSSAIISFYMTGKPIIYCTDTNLPFVGVFKDIIQLSYIAETWEDVKKFIGDISNGIDPKKTERERSANHFRQKQGGSISRILDFLRTNRI